jgi:superfamily II DNA or RNA helicase
MSKYKLTDLQLFSLDLMRKMNACILALSPGCGKTILCLDHVKNDLLKDNNSKCIFFIPKSARAAFKKELSTKLELPESEYIFVIAGKKYNYSDFVNHRYIIVENSIVNKHTEELVSLANNNTCHLVIDEAHSLQNPKSVFASAAWEVRCYCKKIIAMTATPLLNDIEGLFNVLHFVYPGVFKSWVRFRARYCITQEKTIRMKNRNGAIVQRKLTEIVGYQNMKELNDVLDKLIIKGCIHYNVNFNFLECELDHECEKLYSMAAKGFFDILYHPEKVKKNRNSKNPVDDAKTFGSRLHDLQRVLDTRDNDPNYITNKMKLLLSTVKEIMNKNESTLIYFEYLDSLERAEQLLLENKYSLHINNVYKMTGAEKEDYRVKVENNLQPCDVVLCSQAASQSRNLQKSNNIICFHTAWSVGRLIQLLGRICRADSTFDHQNFYFISVSNTIDTYKTSLFKTHKSLISSLLGIEALGTLGNLDDQCNYIDVDLGAEKKMLKNNMLWRRNI